MQILKVVDVGEDASGLRIVFEVKMKTIFAVDNKWGLGKKNDLLFSLKEDMRHFVAHTKGKTVVMGSNTLLSFPGGMPLKNRTNIVLNPNGTEEDARSEERRVGKE